MMKIKYNKIDMCENKCFYPGDIRSVDEKEGQLLISSGAAVEISRDKVKEEKESDDAKKAKTKK